MSILVRAVLYRGYPAGDSGDETADQQRDLHRKGRPWT